MNQRILGIVLAMVIVLLSKLSPHLTLLLPWYLGFLIISRDNKLELIVRISVAPAVGLGLVIVLIHVLSWFGFSLSFAYPIMVILTMVMPFFVPFKFYRIKRNIVVGVAIALILAFVIKLPFEEIPAYPGAVGADAVYHAYKSLEIIKEDTVFISNPPLNFPDSIRTYPAGYHSIIVFISLAHNIIVAQAMRILRLLTWIFLPLGTYSATKSLFKEDNIAVFSAIVMPLSYLYYYYLHYSLLHNFLNYYFFLASVFFYNYSMERRTAYSVFLTTLTTSSMLLIHPYAYMFFQAYAGFVTALYILKCGKLDKQILLVFLIQALGSFLMYCILEYPMRLPLSKYSKPVFNVSKYAFKDNINWLGYILTQTFIENGQLPLGIFFLVGVVYLLHKKDIHSLALLTLIIYDIFLIFNKIYFHIGIPFYSGIWSSERIYVLLTPLIPIVEGLGAYKAYSFLLNRATKPKLIIVLFMLILIVPLFYVNIINFAHQKSTVVNDVALEALEFLEKLQSEKVFVPKFYDSGMWIGIFCPSKSVIPIENITRNSGILYVDSRGYGDIRVSPFNPWDLFGKYEVIYFNDNIWIFNISKKSPAYPKALREYYTLSKDTIEATNFEDWKYLSYGFLLRHPAIIRGIILREWNFVVGVANKSYIVFIPTEEYNAFQIETLPTTTNESIEIKINGKMVGYVPSGKPQKFRYLFKPGNLYILVLQGNPPYAFVKMRLLKT